MFGTEQDLDQLSKIEGFETIVEYYDIFYNCEKLIEQFYLDIAELKLHQLKNKDNKAIFETDKIMLTKLKNQVKSLDEDLEKVKKKYQEQLEIYKEKNGEDNSYKMLDAIYNLEFYLTIENNYSKHYGEEEYLVDINELNKQNIEKKIMFKKIAELEMKENEEYDEDRKKRLFK